MIRTDRSSGMLTPPPDPDSLPLALWYTQQLSQLGALASRLPSLCDSLQQFSFPSVARPIAGLLTLPKYQGAARRLSALIHLAWMTCTGTGIPPHRSMQAFLDQISDDDIVQLEDPLEDVHVANVSTASGNRLLFQGDMVTSDQYVKDALLLLSRLDSPSATSSLRRVHAILRLSDLVCQRSKLGRNISKDSPARIRIEASERLLNDLSQRVTFRIADLLSEGLTLGDLKPFILESNVVPPDARSSESIGHSRLERQPLYRYEDNLLVTLPTEIWGAILRFVLDVCRGDSSLRRANRLLAEIQVQQIRRLLTERWRIDTQSDFRGSLRSGIVDCIGTFDIGSYVHIAYVSDDLEDTANNGLQTLHTTGKALRERTRNLASALSRRSDFRRGLTIVVHGGLGRPFSVELDASIQTWRHVCLPVGDFQLLSWDTEISALRVWKILTQEDSVAQDGLRIMNPGGFVNLYAFLKRRDFEFVPRTIPSGELGSMAIGSEFAGPLRVEIRSALDRHAVCGPDDASWTEVQNTHLDGDLPDPDTAKLCASLEHAHRRELVACMETADRPWWICAEGLWPAGGHRRIVFGTWESAAHLLQRLVPVLEKKLHLPARTPVVYRLLFPDVADFPPTLRLDGPVPERPVIDVVGTRVAIRCPVEYLRGFARADNLADRLLAEALVTAAYVVANQTVPKGDELSRWMQRAIKSAAARSFHMSPVWTAAESVRERIDLPTPRFEQPEDRAWSRLGIAHKAGYTSGTGEIPAEEVRVVLNRSADVVWQQIRQVLEGLDRRSVIEMALLNWESILKDRATWDIAAAAMLANASESGGVLNAAVRRENDRAVAALASRVIAEMAVCTARVNDGMTCTLADLDWLIALVGRLLEYAAQSDAHHYGLSRFPPRVHTRGILECPGVRGVGVAAYWQTVGEQDFREAAAGYGARFSRDQEPAKRDPEFETAFLREFWATPKSILEKSTVVNAC